jgi:hypothetical protein
MNKFTVTSSGFPVTFLGIILLISLGGCNVDKSQTETPKRWVGDISFNEELDDTSFVVCNGEENILQYFNLGKGPVYSGEKPKLLKWFKSNYKPLKDTTQNGYIRIRFIVNCKGKAGRFRLIQSDFNYQETSFDEKITSQLLRITKDVDDWLVLDRNGNPIDYYMYLIFKINEGDISEILP